MITFNKQAGQKILELGGGTNRHPQSDSRKFRVEIFDRTALRKSLVEGEKCRSLDFLGYPDYAVTSETRVLSKKWSVRWNRVESWSELKKAYRGERAVVTLFNQEGEPKSLMVHRLILEAFVGPCPEGMEACHNNGNPRDDRPENLRWDTHKNNMADKERHGTSQCGERSGTTKLTNEKVNQIWDWWEAGEMQYWIAEKMDVSKGTIENILAGRFWKHLFRNRLKVDGKIERRTYRAVGEKGSGAKLKESDVLEIRRLAKAKTSFKKLALKYGVTDTAIGFIVHFKTWKHV